MLDVMRKHAQSWVIKGIFVIIIIVFVLFWTEPREQGSGLQIAATVDGSKITVSEYRRSYDNLLDMYRNVYREGLSEEMLKMLKLKEKALDNLIDSRLLAAEADRLGLRVSDADLVESISKYPAFQKDEVFDKGQYLAVLKANRLTPDEFEKGQMRSLLIKKMEGLIKEGVKVSDDEVWDSYARQKEKVNVELIKIDPKALLKDVKVSGDEAKEYFSKNKDLLKLPTRVKVEYIALKSDDVEKGITITEDELKGFYEKNKNLFKKPEGGEKSFDEVMPQVAVLFRREKTEEVERERIYKLREEAAKAKSLEVAVKDGLSVVTTGYFSAGEMVEGVGANPDFYKEAFALKAGEISQPVKAQDGYMVIKVVERQDARIPEFDEVKEKAIAVLSEKKATEMALKKGEEVLAGLREGKANISRLPYKSQDTGLFARGGSVPNAGASEEMNRAAFSLSNDMPYPEKPFSINGIVYIMKLKERMEAEKEGLKSEESMIKERLRQQKGDEALKNWLKTARTKAKIKISEETLQ